MQIRFKSGARRGETVTPDGDRVVLGRDNTCQVVLDDEKASRRHAAITEYPDGQIVVEDLGSANGTRIDGERLTGPCLVRSGAEVRIGATAFVVTTTEAPPRGRRRAVVPALAVAAVAAVAVVAADTLGGGDDDTGSAGPKKTTTTTPARAPDMERLSAATVLISTTIDGNRTNVASGWVLDADKGLVVTNAHVLHLQRRTGAQRIVVKAA